MKILFINNLGSGFADYVNIPDGTTVSELFEQRMQGRPDDYLIRVNRLPVTRDQILQEGDRVTMTPIRIEGAGV